MLTEIMDSSSVQRLKGLLKSRYGMGLEVDFLRDVTTVDLQVQSPSVMEGDLRIPLLARGQYLGTAIVPDAFVLSNEDQKTVSEVVKLVMEPALFAWRLKHVEANAANSLLEKTPATLPSAWQEGPLPAAEPTQETMSLQFTTNMILLESENPYSIPRAAALVHEVAERWAYLRYMDIRSTLQTVRDLQELGAMTLLVEDLLSLSLQEQALLAEYTRVANSAHEPLILLGCTSPLHELIARKMVHPDLAGALQTHKLNLDRMPKDFSLLRETIELVLDRQCLLN